MSLFHRSIKTVFRWYNLFEDSVKEGILQKISGKGAKATAALSGPESKNIQGLKDVETLLFRKREAIAEQEKIISETEKKMSELKPLLSQARELLVEIDSIDKYNFRKGDLERANEIVHRLAETFYEIHKKMEAVDKDHTLLQAEELIVEKV